MLGSSTSEPGIEVSGKTTEQTTPDTLDADGPERFSL
jgi:hypothetical protein